MAGTKSPTQGQPLSQPWQKYVPGSRRVDNLHSDVYPSVETPKNRVELAADEKRIAKPKTSEVAFGKRND
jgi:hypothetical protein